MFCPATQPIGAGAGAIWRRRARRTPHAPAQLIPRFHYNPAMESLPAIGPSIPPLLLLLFPAILMAVSVAREKEIGTITNFYVTPTSRAEFLIGKQLVYIGITLLNFVILTALVVTVLDVPLKGDPAVLVLGALLYAVAATGYGLVVSMLTKTQVTAVFAAAILSVMPTLQFSGMITPVSSLEGAARIMGTFWPTTWYMGLSVGTFTKGLGLSELVGSPAAPGRLRAGPDLAGGAGPAQAGALIMRRLTNIFWLSGKELKSVLGDPVMVILILWSFVVAVMLEASGAGDTVCNAAIAILDEDNSALTRQLTDALGPPWFQPPVMISPDQVAREMDAGRIMFVLSFPTRFRGRRDRRS